MIFSTQKATAKAKILCTDQSIAGYYVNFWEICLKQIYSNKIYSEEHDQHSKMTLNTFKECWKQLGICGV